MGGSHLSLTLISMGTVLHKDGLKQEKGEIMYSGTFALHHQQTSDDHRMANTLSQFNDFEENQRGLNTIREDWTIERPNKP